MKKSSEHGTETFIKNIHRYQGKAVGFRVDSVQLKNGKKESREYLYHPGAVAVIAIPKPGHIVMVRQFRYPVGRLTWEIPAGKLNKGESPLRCAVRELEEETGFRAKRVQKFISFWPTAAFANEVIHIYLATHLTKGAAQPDEDEFLSTKIWSLKNLFKEIDKGRIKDSKTLIALLAYRSKK